MGFPADLRHFVPIDVAVEANPDPAAMTDVRRPEEPIGLGPCELVLGTRGRRAPQMGEAIIVVPVWP